MSVLKWILIFSFSATFAKAEPIPMEGYASWYGGKFQGRLTANGEIFDTNLLTAAHKTLSFGTLVRVTHLANSQSVIVRINDRGPFIPNRIIDLSKAAADAIGLTSIGVGRVTLEIVQEPKPVRFVTLQVASFSNQINAISLTNRLRKAGLSPSIERTEAGRHRVKLEHIPVEELETIRSRLGELGLRDLVIRR